MHRQGEMRESGASGARKTAEVRIKSTTFERIKGRTAEATRHHKFSERDYLDQQQQQQVQQTSTKK